jgi:hypothetical protein
MPHCLAIGDQVQLRDGTPADADAYVGWLTEGEWEHR